MEKDFYTLAENKKIRCSLGWHMIVNCDSDKRHLTPEQRDQAEKAFFATGAFDSLPKNQVAVSTLRTRLTSELENHIHT